MTQTKKVIRKADQYNDSKHNYQDYWQGREYEHAAEQQAIDKLLKKRKFDNAIDVGGGYGRLSKYITKYAKHVTLAEPSQQQLDIAKVYLADSPDVDQKLLQASNLSFNDNSVDLVLVVRVLHHIPDPVPEFAEIARVLKPGGTFLLEFANNAHGLNQIRYALKRKRVPRTPVDIRSIDKRGENELPFVNHHPKTIIKALNDAGFELEDVLSGSNLRSPKLKKMLSTGTLLALERSLQPLLSPIYFGPSVWLRLKKK